MIFRWLIMICILVPGISAGQPRSITGAIRDKQSGEYLAYSHILSIKDSTGVLSGTDGKFKMTLHHEGSRLVISHIGYTSDTIPVENQQTDYAIYLEASSKTLDEVVITGMSKATTIKENPVSIVLVSPRLIETTLETNVIDVLVRNVPGLNAVKTGPNISKPFIRGLGYNRVLILYDGVRQEGQQWGDEHGIEVDAYNIGKAEVIKGPASLMFGSDALAGVVSLFPYRSTEKDGILKGRILSEYQSNNGLIGNGVRLTQATDHWNWMISGSYRIARNYTNRIDGRVYNTGFDEKNFSASLGHTDQHGHSTLNFTVYDNLQGIPDGSRDSLTRRFTKQVYEGASDTVKSRPVISSSELNSYQLSPLHQHIQHYRLYTNNHYQMGKGDVDASLGFQQNIRREYNHPTDPGQAGMYVRLNTVNYGIRYNAPEIANLEISAGINGMYQNDKSKNATDFPIPDYSLLDIGTYGFIKWRKNRWIISGGLRYDSRRLRSHDFYIRKDPSTGFNQHVYFPDTVRATLQFPSLEQNFGGASWSVGATYEINEKLNLKINVARGYRAPNISEIASNGLDPGAHIVYIGNRNFEPEFSFQQDIGLSGNFRSLSATVNIFHNIIQHYIYLSQLVDEHGNSIELVHGNKTFQYLQGSAQLYGMEASFEFHPKRVRGFTWSSNFSMVIGNNTQDEFRNKGIAGQYLPFIPPTKILTTVQQEFKLKSRILSSIQAKIDIDFNGAQNRYLALYHTETPTPAYALINAGIGWSIHYTRNHAMQLQLQLNNIFDTAYQSNMSRLKYFEYYAKSPDNRSGMYGMGRNFCIRLEFPFGMH